MKNNQSSGVGFVGLLTILFIALKLLGFISWSWWWVLSPIWISALIALTVIIVIIVIILVIEIKDMK